jgi:proline-specific peptidase
MPTAYVNGIHTYYEIAGEGHPLILIHGHTLNLRLWDPQVPAFAAHYRVIRYDLRGHGQSDAPRTGYRWPEYVEDLAELLELLGVHRAYLLGLSLGGGIALEFTLRLPEMVDALILADSVLDGFDYSREFTDSLRHLQQRVRRDGAESALQNVWLQHPLFDGVRDDPDLFQQVQEMVRAFPAMEYRFDQPSRVRPWRQVHRLGEIEVPTLVVVGEKDISDFQRIAVRLEKEIPHARRVVIEGAGHLVNLEQPERFNEVVLEFLSGVGD